MGLKPCALDRVSGGSQSCANEDAQSASRSSRAIRDRDLLKEAPPHADEGTKYTLERMEKT